MESTIPSRAQSIVAASVWFLCGAAVLCVPVGIWSGLVWIGSSSLAYLPFAFAGGFGFVWARARLAMASKDQQYNALDLVGLGVFYFSAVGMFCLYASLVIVLVAFAVLSGSPAILGSPRTIWDAAITAPIMGITTAPSVLVQTIVLGAVAGLTARLGQRPSPSQ